jgi:hypothetical protein
VKLAFAMYAISVAMAQSPPDSLRTYRDPQNRFQFDYPAGFGTPAPGTDNGFRNRTAAIRFSEFSAGVHAGRIILGGEAVLTSEAPQFDLQAAGGLYDAITLQVFPEPVANVIRNALPVMTPDTFCGDIGRERHLDPADQRLTGLTAQQRAAIASVDRMGNITSKVLHCDVVGGTVTFEKEAAFDPKGASRHIYGSVRFLPAPYSSFQLIRGSGDEPGEALLQQITAVVNSWKDYEFLTAPELSTLVESWRRKRDSVVLSPHERPQRCLPAMAPPQRFPTLVRGPAAVGGERMTVDETTLSFVRKKSDIVRGESSHRHPADDVLVCMTPTGLIGDIHLGLDPTWANGVHASPRSVGDPNKSGTDATLTYSRAWVPVKENAKHDCLATLGRSPSAPASLSSARAAHPTR